jgi:hypothetical protein
MEGMSDDLATYPLPSFKMLRELAAQPKAKACIKFRALQVAATGWDINPAATGMGGRAVVTRNWFARPSEYLSLRQWVDLAIHETLELDNLTIYKHRTIGEHAGLLGSNLAELVILDGATVRPVLDLQGQLAGVVQTVGDAPRQGAPLGESPPVWMDFSWSMDDVLYRPRNPRNWTPYGYPPVEAAIVWADEARTVIDFAATDARMPHVFGLEVAERDGKIEVVADNLPWYADTLRDWLKESVFDYVLHVTCDAPDLEWTWIP